MYFHCQLGIMQSGHIPQAEHDSIRKESGFCPSKPPDGTVRKLWQQSEVACDAEALLAVL